MNVPALTLLASAFVGFVSMIGLIANAVFAIVARPNASGATTVLSYTFLAATLGLSIAFIPILASIALDPEERTAYFATWQAWSMVAALLTPHVLWFCRARRPIPAAVIAVLSASAAVPELLSTFAGA